MAFITRGDALARLHKSVADGKPIVGCGAGTGISAKFAEAGGADFIIIYNSGRYRMAGRGSLAGLMPYGDANGIVVEMAAEVLPVVKNTPVQAGVCGTDPFRLMPVFIKRSRRWALPACRTSPPSACSTAISRQPGSHRHGLRQGSRGMIAIAHEMDMLTTPYVFTVEGESDGRGGRGPAGGAHGPDHGRRHRRGGGPHSGRGGRRDAGTGCRG